MCAVKRILNVYFWGKKQKPLFFQSSGEWHEAASAKMRSATEETPVTVHAAFCVLEVAVSIVCFYCCVC